MKTKQELEGQVKRLEREIDVFRDFYCKTLTIGPNDFVVFSTPRVMNREQAAEIRKHLGRLLSFAEDDRRLVVLTAGCELFVMPDMLAKRDAEIAALWQTVRRLRNDPAEPDAA